MPRLSSGESMAYPSDQILATASQIDQDTTEGQSHEQQGSQQLVAALDALPSPLHDRVISYTNAWDKKVQDLYNIHSQIAARLRLADAEMQATDHIVADNFKVQ